MTPDPDITEILRQASVGDRGAFHVLFEHVYAELRSQARGLLSAERDEHTLQPTALVHEAFLRLIDQNRVVWQDRAHFLAIAAQAMRRVLVDHARGRNRAKRSGRKVHLSLDDAVMITDERADPILLALDEALTRLELRAPDMARIVEMRFFGGLTQDE